MSELTKEDIRNILLSSQDVELLIDPYDVPDQNDWMAIEQKFKINFCKEFMWFMEIINEFLFPGDILNVKEDGNTNGNDTIVFTYDHEIKHGSWPAQYIPFYSIGNGDYFCLSSKDDVACKVYYYYHETSLVKKYAENFSEWISDLPSFMMG